MAPIRFLLLLISAAASFAPPALAQDVPPEPEVVAEPEILMPEEVAFNERSAALGQRVLAYDAELNAAARRALSDPAAKAELDAIEQRFQADIDAFIADFVNFAAWKEAYLSVEERDQQRSRVESMASQLETVPKGIRFRAEQAALRAAEAAAAPAS